MINVLWLKGLSCGGDTISFLNADQPDIITAFEILEINLLWHPSLSLETGDDILSLLADIINEKIVYSTFYKYRRSVFNENT